VDPGWVLPRDFLIGLAIQQALPGPVVNCLLLFSPPRLPSLATRLLRSSSFLPICSRHLSWRARLSSAALGRRPPSLCRHLWPRYHPQGRRAALLPPLADEQDDTEHSAWSQCCRHRPRASRLSLRCHVSRLPRADPLARRQIYAAVYHLFRIGVIAPSADADPNVPAVYLSLDTDGFWVSIVGATFVCVDCFGVPAPGAILGGVLGGLAWYGVTSA
jgi:hypothetical protein